MLFNPNISPILKKIIIALLVANIFVAGLAITVFADLIGRIIGIALFSIVAFFALFELISLLKYNLYLKVIFSFFIVAFLMFFPLSNGILDVITNGWEIFSEEDSIVFVDSQRVLQYILSQFKFRLFGITGLGYLFYGIAILIPVLINFKKEFWLKSVKEFIFLFFFVFGITIVCKLIYYWALFKFSILAIILSGIIAADVFAYFGGKFLGKIKYLDKKLAPNISPNKTIIGALCGFLVSFFLLFFSLFYSNIFIEAFKVTSSTSFNVSLFFAFTIPPMAIIGDLAFSFVKRKFKTKDFSNLMPEHGGILDRFDSTIFTMLYFSFVLLSFIK
ncbi:MAG: phosphatidate cytidylyltransferase [Metamycoplasmataceae bacterium]